MTTEVCRYRWTLIGNQHALITASDSRLSQSVVARAKEVFIDTTVAGVLMLTLPGMPAALPVLALGDARLHIDGRLVGQAGIPVTTPIALGLTSGVGCGSAPGAPVMPDYDPPFEFTGMIHSVAVDDEA